MEWGRKGRWNMKEEFDEITACYFGLKVEVVLEMKMCSLIRYREQEYIVDTEDLVFKRQLECVA